MAITRWDPSHELDDFLTRMNRFFGPHHMPVRGPGEKELMTFADWTPACDIQETPEAYVIHAEIPDVRKEDVKVTVHEGVLTLAGERRSEKEEKGKKYHRIERAYGRFQRSFTLPTSVDETKVAASFRDGMLNVMVPKAPPASTAAREVKIGG